MARIDEEGERTETMGRRLASLRALRGWTQAEVAEKAGTTQAYLSLLERDEAVRPPLDTVERLAAIYESSLDYVVRGVAAQPA